MKVTVAVVLAPAAIVAGNEIPLTEKLLDAPLTVAAVTVMVLVPVLLRVTGCEELLPIATEPKVTLAGEAERVAVTGAWGVSELGVESELPVVPQPTRSSISTEATAIFRLRAVNPPIEFLLASAWPPRNIVEIKFARRNRPMPSGFGVGRHQRRVRAALLDMSIGPASGAGDVTFL